MTDDKRTFESSGNDNLNKDNIKNEFDKAGENLK